MPEWVHKLSESECNSFKHKYQFNLTVVYTTAEGGEKIVYFDVKMYSMGNQDFDLKEYARKLLLKCINQFEKDGKVYASCPWLLQHTPQILSEVYCENGTFYTVFEHSKTNTELFILNSQYIVCTEIV